MLPRSLFSDLANGSQNEESRLLYDDANVAQYGSFGEPNLNGDQDSVEAQRESEALQRVVVKTSKLVNLGYPTLRFGN